MKVWHKKSNPPRLEALEDRCLLAADFTLQILHASDLEGGVDALGRAANFAAVIDKLEDAPGVDASITLSAGDNYIPGPFFNAAGDPSLVSVFKGVYEAYFGLAAGSLTNLRADLGRADITLMNLIGFDASALGNHEFDAGTANVLSIVGADLGGGTNITNPRWFGAQFPYLSSNLDFSADASLNPIFTSAVQDSTAFKSGPAQLGRPTPFKKLAPATVIERGGERIGVVGVTTPLLESISSPGATKVKGPGAGTNDMDELASILQPVIDDILDGADNVLGTADDVNKIILVSHLQQIALEKELAPKLSGVDVIIAGGSSTLLADETDALLTGDSADGDYPFVTENADQEPVLIVSTDQEYKYVGRLVVQFDAAGVLHKFGNNEYTEPAVSGAYAANDATVSALWGNLSDPFAAGTRGALVKQITDAVRGVVTAKDAVVYGRSDVYLNGLRNEVRTQETNLGSLSADANLAAARGIDPTVVISIKNGGGVRDSIGTVNADGERIPTEANPASGKAEGRVSQLDIENSLRFNNTLSLVTLTAENLKKVLEHGVAATAPGATPGQFAQVGGIAFSFDATLPAGSRIRSVAVKDDKGNVLDVVVKDGAVVGDPGRAFRVVTLGFLAAGGDNYPFPALATNVVNTTLGEQKALADYLQSNHSVVPYAQADTPASGDLRIQNLAFREDTVLVPAALSLVKLGGFQTANALEAGGAEVSAYDPASKKLFVVNLAGRSIDVLDLSDPASITRVAQIDVTAYGNAANSVAVRDGVVAVAVEASVKTSPGQVVFFDTNGNFQKAVAAGALPDMLTFTPDGKYVLVANEGEPNSYGLADSVDPVGSVTVIDISKGVKKATAMTAGFTAYNGQEAALRAQGIRLFGPGASAAQDLEPEYITVSDDSKTAYVTLQENNAIAVIDVKSATVTDLNALGTKDFSRPVSTLETFTFTQSQLGLAGTTPAGQDVNFGGFSGLFFEGYTSDGKLKFITHTDRGPNGEPNAQGQRPFLVPGFSPQLVRFTLDPASGELTVTEKITLKDGDGTPLTGLPNLSIAGANANTAHQDEAPIDLGGNVLSTDPLGGDFEGIAVDPKDGTFWMVDEYRPAIYHFAADGTLIDRFVPRGAAAAAGAAAGTFGEEVLPAVLAQRRQNRGFEAVAIQDGRVYAFVQSPLRNPTTASNATLNGLRNTRVVEFDPRTKTTKQFMYIMDNPPAANADDTRADKIGDAVSLGNGEFLVVERDDDAIDSDASGNIQKKVYRFSLAGATDITGKDGLFNVNGVMKSIDQMTEAELSTFAGVTAIKKTLHVDLNTVGYNTVEKVEGLALIDANTIAVVNDNDFGVAGITINTADGTFTLAPGYTPEPVVLGLIRVQPNGLDASDRDGPSSSAKINIVPQPVHGMYMPDAIASYTVDGVTYLVTANEGDARDWPGLTEEVRVGSGSYVLDPTAFPNAAALKNNASLGRLTVSKSTGDTDGDGDYDRIDMFGARSFSIWTAGGELVYDSGSEIETITARLLPKWFNAGHTNNSLDDRSDNKGPEPESVTLGKVGGRTYAFVGLERIGGVMVYDVTDPRRPSFVTYANSRDFTIDPATGTANNTVGDLGPEGVLFISEKDSPNGSPLLVVSNEISNTVTVYQIVPAGRVFDVGSKGDDLTLRKNGAQAELVDEDGEVIFSQPLALTNSITVNGAKNKADSLTVDFAFGGELRLGGGVTFNGGSGGADDTFAAVGTAGNDAFSVTGNAAAVNGLGVTLSGVEAVRFEGGAGDDTYALARTNTQYTVKETAGTDTLDFSRASAGVDIDLSRTTGVQVIGAGGNKLRLSGTVENVIGTAYDDVLLGNSAGNVVRGLGGDDYLDGGSGDDLLSGGDGDDTLLAWLGNDLVIGGLGGDLISGAFGDDLIVSGAVSFEDDGAALMALFEDWTEDRDSSLLEPSGVVIDDGVTDLVFALLGDDELFTGDDDVVLG